MICRSQRSTQSLTVMVDALSRLRAGPSALIWMLSARMAAARLPTLMASMTALPIAMSSGVALRGLPSLVVECDAHRMTFVKRSMNCDPAASPAS